VRSITARKRGVLALGVLFLIGVFGFLGLGAGETADETSTAVSNPPLNVAEANKDANGNIRVHEQGTVAVTGTVNVGNNPAVQDVRITNNPLHVDVDGRGTVQTFFEEIFPFDKDQDFEVDISEFNKVRLFVNINGDDSTVDIYYSTDAGVEGSFSVSTVGSGHSVYLGEVPGTKLWIEVRDPDGEQVFIWVFGNK